MAQDRRPNVLWLMSDQHNANCMGHAGRNVRTPTLDSIAEDGIRFTQAFCNNPICAPSRISYITGTYPHTHRHVGNNLFEYAQSNTDTISAVARRHGYQTAIIGKGHIVGQWNREGFEHIRYCDLCDAARVDPMTNHYFRYLCENGIADLYDLGSLPDDHPGRGTQWFVSEIPHEHSVEVWTGRETRKFLEGRDRRRPFFVQMSFQRPHAPLSPSPERADMYAPEDVDIPDSARDLFERQFATKPQFQRQHISSRRGYPYVSEDEAELRKHLTHYYALISIMDEEMAKVLDVLREQGELENTIIVYVADHGDFGGDHGLMQKNMGIYDSINRVPFLLRYPDCPSGRELDGIIESVDLYPTLAELMDVEVPDVVEGRNLTEMIEGDGEGKQQAVCEWSRPEEPGMLHSIRTPAYRLVYYGANREGELYDHRNDPDELQNVYEDSEYAAVRQELTERLLDHVMKYEKRTDWKYDRQEGHRTRNTMTRMLHKRGFRWSEIEHLYTE